MIGLIKLLEKERLLYLRLISEGNVFWSYTEDPKKQILDPYDYSPSAKVSAYLRYKIRIFIDVSQLPWAHEAIDELKAAHR